MARKETVMQQYNIFQALYMSFYSKKLYRDIALNWGGKSFLYLLMLLTIISIYFAVSVQKIVTIGYESFYTSVSPQVPILTIKGGKINTPENRPYFIIDPETKYTYAIIDTTGRYTTIEQAKAPVLVTQTQIITQTKQNETKTYTIPADLQQKIDPQQVNGYVHKFLGFLWILFFILCVFGFYIYRLVQAVVYSLIGKLFAMVCNIPLNYGQILQIAMVAITPDIIISTIQFALGININHELILYFLLAIMYLFYGIIANKTQN